MKYSVGCHVKIKKETAEANCLDVNKIYEIVEVDALTQSYQLISTKNVADHIVVFGENLILVYDPSNSIRNMNNYTKEFKEVDNDNECTISVKNDVVDDKLRWDLLPLQEIEEIVKVYHAGAKKYGPNRWQNLEDGYNRYKAAMIRHLLEYEKGERYDKDTGCMHLAQLAWNAIALLYLDKHGKGLIEKENDQRI